MPQWRPGDSAARLSYDMMTAAAAAAAAGGMPDQQPIQGARPPSSASSASRPRRRLLSFSRRPKRVQAGHPDQATQYADQQAWAAGQITRQLFIQVRETIRRCQRAHFAVFPASMPLLQSIWFHPMTTSLLQNEGGAISNQLRIVGLITAVAWYNPLTQRIVLLYNDDILSQAVVQDLEAIRVLAYSLLPLAAAAEMEQQRRLHLRPLRRTGSRPLVRHVPAWGAIYHGGRGHPMLLGHYPAEVLDSRLAEAYQHYAGPLLLAERQTIPQLPVWREVRRPNDEVC